MVVKFTSPAKSWVIFQAYELVDILTLLLEYRRAVFAVDNGSSFALVPLLKIKV